MCPQYLSVTNTGVTGYSGLLPNNLWQMDVTHIAKFGTLKYVRVTVDTYPGFLMVTAQTEEATKPVISHCLKCFAYMGVPKIQAMDLDILVKHFNILCTIKN